MDDEGFDSPSSAYEIAHLTSEARAELATRLDDYGVPHRFVGSELHAPAAETELVEDLIAFVARPIDARAEPPSPLGRGAEVVPSALTAALASPWRRILGFIAQGFVAWAFLAGVRLATSDTGGELAAVSFGLVNGIVLVGTTGRTIGMWLVDVKVVVPPSAEPPPWGPATIRYLVLSGPGIVGLALHRVASMPFTALLDLANMLWLIACGLPMLFDPLSRGIHDRVAKTVVVRAGAVGPLE